MCIFYDFLHIHLYIETIKIYFEKNILLPLSNDKLDEYRKEYNKMLLDKATGANGITQEKFITVSFNKKSVEEARN